MVLPLEIRHFTKIQKEELLVNTAAPLILCAEHGANLTGASPVTGIYRQV